MGDIFTFTHYIRRGEKDYEEEETSTQLIFNMLDAYGAHGSDGGFGG